MSQLIPELLEDGAEQVAQGMEDGTQALANTLKDAAQKEEDAVANEMSADAKSLETIKAIGDKLGQDTGEVAGPGDSAAGGAGQNKIAEGLSGPDDEPSVSGGGDDQPDEPSPAPSRPSRAFNRQRDYGGSQTTSEAGRAARAEAEGKPCPVCDEPMISGTPTQPEPEHNPPLVEHYYEHGGHEMTDEERRAYARSEEGIDGSSCKTCQRKQGAALSRKSRGYKKQYGF
jgi:hypothetical protein